MAGGWLGVRPMGVSGWPHGIESQRLPGQAMTGIGPDVVKPPKVRTMSVVSVS